MTLKQWVTHEYHRGTSEEQIRRIASPWSDRTGEDESAVLNEIDEVLTELQLQDAYGPNAVSPPQ